MESHAFMRTVILFALLSLALPALGQDDPKLKKELQQLFGRLTALETRVNALKKHEKTSDFRGDEATWQAQDAQVEALKKDFNTLSADLRQFSNKLPPQGSSLGPVYGNLSKALDAFGSWMQAHGSYLFLGKGSDLKAAQANVSKLWEEYRRARDSVAASLKK